MRSAERKVFPRKLAGNLPWSPTLVKTGKEVQYFAARCIAKEEDERCHRPKPLGTSDDPENNLDTLKGSLAQAKAAHQRAKTTAEDLCSNFLTNLADEVALDRNVKHGTA